MTAALPLMLLAASQLDPHVHGAGSLSITSEASTLVIEMVVDQHTLFGFEGEPITDAQHATVERVSKEIQAPGALYLVETSVPCQRATIATGLRSTEDELGHGLGPDEDHHEDHDDHDGHDNDHHEDHHDDHGDHHAEHDEQHQDFALRETLQCEGAPEIRKVTMPAFDKLPSLERVDIVVLTQDQQMQRVATRTRMEASF